MIRIFRPVGLRGHWLKPCGKSINRFLSSEQFPSVKKVEIVSNLEDLSVEVKSHWQDYCEIVSKPSDLQVIISLSDSDDEGNLSIAVEDDTATGDKKVLQLLVPEMINILIQGSFKEIKFENKIYGNVHIENSAVNTPIVIDKMKGSEISIYNPMGDIQIKKVLEGNIFLNCSKISGKMLNGDNIAIQAIETLNIEAMYGGDTRLDSSNLLKLGLFKGRLRARSQMGPVSINGFEGSCEISSDCGNIDMQINALRSTKTLENSNLSSIKALTGCVNCLLDPEIKSKIDCEITSPIKRTEDNPKTKAIHIDSDAFVAVHSSDEKVIGTFEGDSKALKRPTYKDKGRSNTGKIDLKGAEGGYDLDGKQPIDHILTIQAYDGISVKTTSWIEIIRKKHGY